MELQLWREGGREGGREVSFRLVAITGTAAVEGGRKVNMKAHKKTQNYKTSISHM